MIEKLTRYTIFNSNNSWILTTEKIASSWLKGQFDFNYTEIFIDSYTYELRHIKRDSYLDVSESVHNELQVKFSHDWNKFVNGSNEYNFIFFIRNPVNKFMTGWVQDFVIRKLNVGFIEQEIERLSKHFYHKDVDKFINYALKEKQEGGDRFPEVDSIPFEFKNIFKEFCFPSRHHENFFHTEASVLIEHTRSGHIPENLYLLWKLLFKKPFEFNNDNLYVLDIDLEDTKSVLENKFNIPANKDVDKYVRHPYFKTRTYDYLSKEYVIINALLETEIFFWFEIVSKLYPSISQFASTSVPKYKERFYIPNELEFYDLETHMNWWKYEPPETWLKYTKNTL
jgi:hypothetical protein